MTKSLNCSITCFLDFCILQDLATKRMIGLGRQHNGLYYFSTNTTPLPNLLYQKSTKHFHNRIYGKNVSATLPFNQWNILQIQYYKFLSLPIKFVIFVLWPNKQDYLLVWALLPLKIFSSLRYSGTFLSLFYYGWLLWMIRYTWVYSYAVWIRNTETFKIFFALVLTQFNYKVKKFRIDNDKEFTSLQRFFQDEEIIYEHICVSTPLQNGVAECKHRHILNVARALRF